jgi:hypothetical protein
MLDAGNGRVDACGYRRAEEEGEFSLCVWVGGRSGDRGATQIKVPVATSRYLLW